MPYQKPLRPDSYVKHTLQRYSDCKPHKFQRYVLLTNFSAYLDRFREMGECTTHKRNWEVVHNKELEVSMMNFGIGSPLAGMAMHCVSYLDQVDAVIMLGLAGGLAEEMQVGDFVLPTASIRDEGTSRHYLQTDVPAEPNFKIQHIIQQSAGDMDIRVRSGIFKTTDYRMWEFDEEFADLLRMQRVVAIDMEIATLFSVGYAMGKPIGALMLISDMPLLRSGVKTTDSTDNILADHSEQHMQIGLKAIENIRNQGVFQVGEVLPFEW
jgi:AMP nucleosidase